MAPVFCCRFHYICKGKKGRTWPVIVSGTLILKIMIKMTLIMIVKILIIVIVTRMVMITIKNKIRRTMMIKILI